jgi:hypothetical protein
MDLGLWLAACASAFLIGHDLYKRTSKRVSKLDTRESLSRPDEVTP